MPKTISVIPRQGRGDQEEAAEEIGTRMAVSSS